MMVDLLPENTDFHLCVANVVNRYHGYRQYYRRMVNRGDWVMMDTPAFEGVHIQPETYIDAIDYVNPTEVILPDVFGKGPETATQSRMFAKELLNRGFKGVFAAVPQGKTLEDYLECLSLLVAVPGVLTIGVIEEIDQLYPTTREDLVMYLRGAYPDKLIHLCGVKDDLNDLKDEGVRTVVRSADTAKFVVWGLNDVYVSPDEDIPTYPGRKSLGGRMEYFAYDEVLPGRRMKVRDNIRTWKEFLSDGISHVR
jgi:hypothetical protein